MQQKLNNDLINEIKIEYFAVKKESRSKELKEISNKLERFNNEKEKIDKIIKLLNYELLNQEKKHLRSNKENINTSKKNIFKIIIFLGIISLVCGITFLAFIPKITKKEKYTIITIAIIYFSSALLSIGIISNLISLDKPNIIDDDINNHVKIIIIEEASALKEVSINN